MSQSFKLKSDELKRNSPTSNHNQDNDSTYKRYPAPGHVRNISFVLLDGTRLFLNYAYMVSCGCDVEFECIEIAFTSHDIVIKGLNLKQLYYDLLMNMPLELFCSDARYNQTLDEAQLIINDIGYREK